MRRNQTAFVILGMLGINPMSGYDIHKAIQGSVAYFWSESYGQIYPTLKGLAAEGLIAPGEASAGVRSRRRVYSLSAKGRAALRAWLAEPPRAQPPRIEILLKLFFGRSAPPPICAGHLREFRNSQQRALDECLEFEKQFVAAKGAGDPGLPFRRATWRYGIFHLRASIAWADETLAFLAQLEQEATRKKTRPKP
jgi:PadR family transcriptional regulator AphA